MNFLERILAAKRRHESLAAATRRFVIREDPYPSRLAVHIGSQDWSWVPTKLAVTAIFGGLMAVLLKWGRIHEIAEAIRSWNDVGRQRFGRVLVKALRRRLLQADFRQLDESLERLIYWMKSRREDELLDRVIPAIREAFVSRWLSDERLDEGDLFAVLGTCPQILAENLGQALEIVRQRCPKDLAVSVDRVFGRRVSR